MLEQVLRPLDAQVQQEPVRLAAEGFAESLEASDGHTPGEYFCTAV